MDGEINFKAYFDYGDAMRGVDDLAGKFEAAGMKLNDAFNFGRAFEGSKQELKKFIGDLESTIAGVRQQIKDASTGLAGDESLAKALEEQIRAAEATAKQAQAVYEDAASQVLKAREKAYGGIEKQYEAEEESIAKLKAQYDEMTEAFQTQDPTTIEDDTISYYEEIGQAITEAENRLVSLRESLDEARTSFNEQNDNSFLENTRDSAKEAWKNLADLKKQLQDLKSGVGGSGASDQDLDDLKKKADQLDAALKGAKQRLKDPDIATGNAFNGLTQGVQGLLGAYTAASGVLAQFGADEKDLQKIQTQLQGSMSLLMGLQQVYNALQEESAFRTQVVDKVMLGLSKTYKKVAASSALAKLGIAGLVTGVVIGIASAVAALSKLSKASKEARKVQNEAAASMADQVVAYMRLQKQWKEAEGNLKKQNEVLADSKWGKIAVDVRNVNDAQRVLVDESDNVIEALMAQAEAAALYGIASEKAEKAVKKMLRAESLEEGANNGIVGNLGDWIIGGLASMATGNSWREEALNHKRGRAAIAQNKGNNLANEARAAIGLGMEKENKAEDNGLNNEETERLKEAGHKVSELMKEQKRERERLAKDMEFDVRQKRIDAMKESSARELSQLSLDHDKEMETLKRQQEDRLKQLQDEQIARQKAGNPNLKDYQAGSSIKSLPKEEADRFREQQTLLNEAFERAKADLLEKYGTLEERRKRLSDRWQKDISATTDADVRAILEKEARADIANFEYENVSEFGTTQQVYAALKAKLEAEADLIADDAQRTIALASAEVQLAELKYKDSGNYRNYEKELEATNAIYDAKIREAQARKDVAGAEVLEKEKMSALQDLRKEYTAMYDLIFSSAETMTNNNLAKAIEYTQQAIKDSKGDAKELAELYERLRGFQAEQNSRNTGWGFGGIRAGFRSIMNAREWQSLAESQYVSEEDKKRYQQNANTEAENGFSGISKGVSEISEAFDGMGDALDKFGGSVAEFGKALKEMGKQARGVGDFFSNLDADFKVKDKGQVINQAIQGTLELISMVGSQIAKNKETQEEWNRTVEESAHKLTMLEIDKLAYKQSNIFGVEDPFKKATDSANVYFKSMEEVAKLTDKLNGGQVQTGTKKGVSGENIMKGVGAGAAVGAAIGTAVGGWAAGLGTVIGTAIGAVVGGITGLVGGLKEVPVFESLEEHYEYLFDPKTYELNPELLADYDKLDESTKQIVDHWDEIREKALKAQEDLRKNLSEFVGDVGNNLRSTLVEAWSNRQLYASIDKFKDYVSDAIAGILEQKVFSSVFGGLFDQIGEAMEASFIGPYADNDITDELDMLFQKLPGYLDAYDRAMTQAQDQMEANGYEGFYKRQENASATAGSFQQISETTGSVIAGGVTAIRLLLEQKKATDAAEGLQLGGIASSVEDLRGMSLISMGYLENIAEHTSVLPYMRDTLDNIERRTRSL